MRFPSSLFGSKRQEQRFNRGLVACVFFAILAPLLALGAFGQSVSETPSEPSAESPKKEVAPGKDAIKKYDVSRIGQRDIGRGFNLYSVRREHELGRNLAALFDRETKIISDATVNDYVNRLALKIVGHSDADVPFTIKVIDSGDIPRAYGLPGGFLYVDSALIIAADGEAELAGMIAREIAHVAARHATRALTRRELWRVAGSMALVAGPAGMAFQDAEGIAGPLSVKKFVRDAEFEADLLGIEYAYAAGYDPQSLLDALEKLHAMEARRNATLAKIPGYHMFTRLPFHGKIARGFASYPLTDERIQRLQSEISVFLPTRRDYVLDTDEFQQVKSILLASHSPVLRRTTGDDDKKGPVLRRSSEYNPDAQAFPGLPMTFTSWDK
ncbi:MAG TPA: M48 family metalloprotease [Candidatus Sulfotelmatobacter sp.]|jgi:predicted Zn-dependent protease|nr:M48 family metalloprotease [Candidatus Sulfotelmatobacter sp.]